MQRWIIAGVVFVVLSIVMLIGAYVGYRAYKQNQMTGIWLPLPMEQASVEQRGQVVKEFQERLGQPELMTTLAKDSGFTQDFGFASDAEAGNDLLGRFFSREGTFKTPDGRAVPVVEVGFTCKVKEYQRMEKVASELSKQIQSLMESSGPRRPADSDDAF